jgi:hypothetical protein
VYTPGVARRRDLLARIVPLGRSSFLKKRSKKLLFLGARWGQLRDSQQKFFGSFFQKRTFFALPCIQLPKA